MHILILGGQGMAGHMINAYFQKHLNYRVSYTSRNTDDENSMYLDVSDSRQVEEIISSLKPDIIINCIGILNEHASANPNLATRINGELPHQLVQLTEQYGGKLIHISTDCVFSGAKGNYTETDLPDGTSVYAVTKQHGEIINEKHLTIRTSIIGPELKDHGIGLFLWFMKQHGTIYGYERVFWNGVTTLELAKAIHSCIQQSVTGLYHLAAPKKISKYELLLLMQAVYAKYDVEIIPSNTIVLDRTIVSTRADFVYHVPSYKQMLEELKQWEEQQ